MPDNTVGSAPPRRTFTGLPWDEDQELKEAVCDAVLERTRRVVSGDGEFGQTIYGQLPSRALTSAFLVPRLSEDNDDVSSDIAISLHGLDCRLNANVTGVLRLTPQFNVYIRTLPTAEEVFEKCLRLRPKAELNAAAIALKTQAMRALRESPEFKTMSPAQRREARKEALTKFLTALGATVQKDDIREAEADGTQEGEQALTEILDGNARLPDEYATTHEVPEKYVRLTPELPMLELPLPWSEAAWTSAVDAYDVTLNAAVASCYQNWLASELGTELAWRKGRIPSSSFWTPTTWNARLTELRQLVTDPKVLLPGMKLKTEVDARVDPFTPEVVTVRFGIENYQSGKSDAEQGIFNVSLQLDLPSTALRHMPLERVRRSYHFAGFLLVPAIGVNGGVVFAENEDRATISTTWCPRFVLPRMRPTSRARVPVSFTDLSSETLEISELHNFPSAMDEWVGEVEANPVLNEPGEEGTPADEERQKVRFIEDLHAWRREAKRIRHGINLLASSQASYRQNPKCLEGAPYRAWLLTNETFKATGNPGWRLFQLGFILTHVPTLASRMPEFHDFFDYDFDEGSASLLYMSTGGGKSEAFFGALVFALFLDRLRGKRRGVTAMLHYPLRLLTLQQARRLMRLLAAAEILRIKQKIEGAPFAMGFWVGSGNTPNSVTKGNAISPEAKDIPLAEEDPFLAREDEFLLQRDSYDARNDAWNKLPECPFCQDRTGLRIFSKELNRLGIVCSSAKCDWNKAHDTKIARKPLPILIVDQDIYRHAPSVLLGTVDKLALIGNHPSTINRIAGMFGLARYVVGDDDQGLLLSPLKPADLKAEAAMGRPVMPAFSTGADIFHDPLPSMIVQDEMHLLEESLGTFGGLFETTLFAFFEELSRLLGHRTAVIPGSRDHYRQPHVVGATATAADADRQMQHLYQKRAVQFPHPGPRLYGSFYTELEVFDSGGEAAGVRGDQLRAREQESLSPWGRVYASLLTNGKTHTTATIEILAAYAVGITRWSRDLCSRDVNTRARACNEMVASLSIGRLTPRHAAVLCRAGQDGNYEILAKLVDLHRIMLTYVTNKKGGDQLISALDRQVARQHELAGPQYELSQFDIELISGGVDIKGIRAVIAKAERQRNPTIEDIENCLRAIVATSAISHGVDVSTFNAMTFAGIPSDIAEYIQASSRVGRTHVGFSLLIPTPQNRRDRFVLDNHETFHRFLERMISPPAIERWADKAIRRVLPSLIQTYLIGVLFQAEFVARPDNTKTNVGPIDGALALRDRLVGGNALANKNAVRAFLERALGLNSHFAGAPSPDHYRNLSSQVIEDIAAELQTGRHGGDLAAFWGSQDSSTRLGKPMNSLRDIDEGGLITGGAPRKTVTGRPIKPSDTRAAMDFITKRRIAGRLTAAETGELASE